MSIGFYYIYNIDINSSKASDSIRSFYAYNIVEIMV